jgi:hypothetical protein
MFDLQDLEHVAADHPTNMDWRLGLRTRGHGGFLPEFNLAIDRSRHYLILLSKSFAGEQNVRRQGVG